MRGTHITDLHSVVCNKINPYKLQLNEDYFIILAQNKQIYERYLCLILNIQFRYIYTYNQKMLSEDC